MWSDGINIGNYSSLARMLSNNVNQDYVEEQGSGVNRDIKLNMGYDTNGGNR